MDELERLAIEAEIHEAEEQAKQPVMPGQEPAPVIDPAQEWRDLARMGAGLVLAPVPELAGEWTAPRIDAFGDALAKCAEHYGWTTGGILGHPLAGLALAAFPLALPVIRMTKAKKAEKRQETPAAVVEPEPAGEGAGKSVTFG